MRGAIEQALTEHIAAPSSSWPTRRSGRLSTAFGEVTCKDGFRCVSSTLKFGRNHPFGSDVTAPDAEDMEQDPDAEPTYEWNCPYRGSDGGTLWSAYKYTSGSGSDECEMANRDCMCISRQSDNYRAELQDGKEIITGKFGVDQDGTVVTPELAELQKLRIIPHYAMRQLPESFNLNDPHSDMGQITTLPQKEYLDKWNMYSSLLQMNLDTLKKKIEKQMKPLAGSNFQCGDGGVMTLPQANQLVGQIRRFQILGQDCETMRESIAKLAPSPEMEQFDDKVGTKKLECYKKHGAKACTQLNCYNSAKDAGFRRELAEFRHEIAGCGVPEEDLTEANAQPPEAAAQQGVGFAVAAGAALVPQHPHSERDEKALRPTWRTFVLRGRSFL